MRPSLTHLQMSTSKVGIILSSESHIFWRLTLSASFVDQSPRLQRPKP